MARSFNWHPLLLALYPILHLLARNTASVRPQAAYLSLAVTAVAVVIFWFTCSLVLRDRGKGTLLAALAAVLFFAHGHLLGLLGGATMTAEILIAFGVLFLAVAGWLLFRWPGDPRPWNRALDVASLALVIMALVPVVSSEMRPPTNLPPSAGQTGIQAPLGYLPDIYIIILDAFGRADQLHTIYDVDLSGLQEHLARRGFVIAERAHANYCQTSLSLAALLNSAYLPELLPDYAPDLHDKTTLNAVVHRNRNVTRLRAMGYQLVTLAGGSELSVQADPDVNYRGGALNEFQSTLLATTPLPVLADLFHQGKTGRLDPFAQHSQTVRYQFRKLPNATAAAGPKLVFAHIISPHPPFVLGPDGEEIKPDYGFTLRERRAWNGYVAGYAGQATWVAKQVQTTVDGILASSRRTPVILIMGDHGPASRWIKNWRRTNSFDTTDPGIITERMSLFLALLMPPGTGGEVYPTLTPINIFPLIYERCFGEPAVLKADHGYFSTYEDWARFFETDAITDVK